MKLYSLNLLGDKTITIKEGQTILDASLAAGIPHYHECGGNAQCSTCRILIKEGNENLSGYSAKEVALRKKLSFQFNVRLACQTYVSGEHVEAHRMIRDETDIGFYINEDNLISPDNTGQEKELALFFLDIRNFTPFTESYLPFDVIHIMRRLFALFRNAIEHNKGSIIETSGDGFYAVFGFETSIEEAVQNACDAGYQLLNDVESFNENYMYKNFRRRFQVGIGVHEGKVITGNIGIGVNNNLTVMGLPVNIASRLQASTKEVNNNFVISAIAFEKLMIKPNAMQKEIKVQGIKENLSVYLLGKSYFDQTHAS